MHRGRCWRSEGGPPFVLRFLFRFCVRGHDLIVEITRVVGERELKAQVGADCSITLLAATKRA